MPEAKERAPYNRTITLTPEETDSLLTGVIKPENLDGKALPENKTILGDVFTVLPLLPGSFADLLILDPPYNIRKKFNTSSFSEQEEDVYAEWIESWIVLLKRLLKKDASVYFCCDWKTSVPVYNVLKKHFKVRNRITWEREKGRGSKDNYKNCTEDIWYCTNSNNFLFNVDAVKLRRQVLAPYKTEHGQPKDWEHTEDGKFRDTYPSNFWSDISIPFWSMPENTDHPTQKPEKLIAKLILASSEEGAMVFDPFLGSGTTSVTAKKLRRRYLGIELDPTYAALAEKRLSLADENPAIQGYADGVFWERNSLRFQREILSGNNNKSLFE